MGSTGSLEASDQAAAAVQKTPNRVTLDSIHAKAVTCDYLRSGVMTIAVVTLENGYTVLGKSAPADAANFNEELGRKFAYEDAVRQVWPLEGYLLRERLFREGGGPANSGPVGAPQITGRD